VATDDSVTTNEDTPITINVLGNDSDSDGNALSITSATATNGTVSINLDGTLSYTPNANFYGSDSISYGISDGNGGSSSAVVDVTVIAVNMVPEASDDTITTNESTSVTIDVLGNDSDLDNDILTVTTASALNGTVQINIDGTLSYTPNENFNGIDSIYYEASDGRGGFSNATVTVTVNSKPTANDDFASVDAGSNGGIANLLFDIANGFVDGRLLSNDTDAEGQALILTQVNGLDLVEGSITVAGSNGGTFTITSDGSANFDASTDFVTLAAGETVVTEVTYTISDSNGSVDTATVQVMVNGQNDAVLAEVDQVSATEDNIIVLDVMANDSTFVSGDIASVSAVNGDAANVGTSVTGSNGGLFIINADGSATFDANGEYEYLTTGDVVTTSVTYTLQGFGGETSTTTVEVQVTGVNSDPVAGDDFATVDAGSNGGIANLLFDILNGFSDERLLSNDTDAEGQALTLTQVNGFDLVDGSITVAGSNGGTFTIASDGSANFDASTDFVTLAAGETAITEVTYTINDGYGGFDTATVQVTVNGQNDAVQAEVDLVSADEDSIIVLDVMANDSTFVSGDIASVSAVNGDVANVGTSVSGSNGGLFTINTDGSATFDANGEYDYLTTGDIVTTSVTYTLQGFGGETSTTTVEVQVTGVNSDPVAGDDFATVDAGSNGGIANLLFDISNGFTDERLLSNDTDTEGQTLTLTQVNGLDLVDGSITVAGSNGGFFTITADGSASFDASTGFESLAGSTTAVTEAVYTVSDGNGGFDTATVQVTVVGPNNAPEAVTDTAIVNEDSSIVINVLENDTDVDGDVLSVVNADAANGIVSVNADNTITYIPNADFNGLDTINYVISDGIKNTSSTVSVTVNPVNDNPISVDDFIHVNSTGTTVIDVLANDIDVDGDALTVTSAMAINGNVVINSDGTLSYTPDNNIADLDTISYEITDGYGETSSAIATINRRPVALDDYVATEENTAVTINALSNDNDVEGDSLTMTSATAINGNVIINGDGTLLYTPNTGFIGSDSISYDVRDSNGGLSTATVNVTVGGTGNSAPVAGDDFATVDAGSNGGIANLLFDILNGFVDGRLLSNDTDAEGQTLTLTQVNGLDLVDGSITVAGSNGGTFTIASDGSASFDASSGFTTLAVGETAITEVTYTISDGYGGFDTATVQVTVNGQNDAVLAEVDQLSATENSIIVLDVMANDSTFVAGDIASVSAVNGDAANVGTSISGSNGGLFTINADGSATFDANSEYEYLTTGEVVTTSVTYTLQGFGGETSTTTVEVQVTGTNNDPVAGDDFATVDAGSNGGIANLLFDILNGFSDERLLSNDTDAEGQTLTLTQVNGLDLVDGSITVAGSNGGLFTIASDGSASFDASSGFEALAAGETAITEVTYTISDGNGGFDTATVQVTVNGINDAPVASDDSAVTDETNSIVIDVLSNDIDVDGQALSISNIDTAGVLGLVSDNGDGTITYDANGQFDSLNDGESATEWFEYTIDDGAGGFDTAQVQLTIMGSTDNTASSAPPEIPPASSDPVDESVPPDESIA